MPDDPPVLPASSPRTLRGVFRVLIVACAIGALLAASFGLRLGSPALLDAAVALGLGAGTLLGVAGALRMRQGMPGDGARAPATEPEPDAEPAAAVDPSVHAARKLTRIQTAVAIGGALAIMGVLSHGFRPAPALPPWTTALAVLVMFVAAWIGLSSSSYLAGIGSGQVPEAAGLSRGARVLAWALVLVAAILGLDWVGWSTAALAIHALLLLLGSTVVLELAPARVMREDGLQFPVDLRTFRLLGSRSNPLASSLDELQRVLGIDLRSSWALTLVRRSAEPLAIATCLLGWLSTGVTIVGVDEEAIVERLGVPQQGPTLAPGWHFHWPVPIDDVVRIPVQRIQTVAVGHEGENEKETGPEDVLWARQHGGNEYTLLLGNGRDLIAIDAALQFRITDAGAWRYHCKNPTDALRGIAYRAVMKSTAGRTLAETLSENMAALTAGMRAMVQSEADELGLGIRVVGFTVGGMHPPVRVAKDYQAVVSAELGKTTAAIGARVYHNQVVPGARADVVRSENVARADGIAALARAQGEAWSFRTLEAQYKVAGAEYRFRRRLEALENDLAGRHFTVLDQRLERDGGELWLTK